MDTIELKVEQYTNDEGQLVYEAYYLDDKLHNPHGPAVRRWNHEGQLVYESYWLNGKLHNPHGPAFRRWNDEGQLIYESYWLNDKSHNPNGPAYREWDAKGQLIREDYWLNGRQFSKDQFLLQLNSCNEQLTERETTFFRWAYSLLVTLAKEELKKAQNDDGEWPMRQEWSQLNGSSRSIFLFRAREAAGIPDKEFLQIIRDGLVDVDDLYEGERLE